MRGRVTAWSICMIVGLGGCLGRGETDLLTARLREQQARLADAESRLEATARELKLARKESEGLRTQLAQGGSPGLLPEQSDVLIRASAIRINPMLTAGFDRDDAYGDDALVVHFVPVDDEGEVVRLPGAIQIRALDPTLSGERQTIAEWNFTAEESREHWLRGFLGTGYQFTLPWPRPPTKGELVVHVQLRPVDGREFTANHVVKITPPVATAGHTQPAAATDGTATLKPTPSREPLDDSSSWMRDDVPLRR